MTRALRRPFHPILFALFSVLALLASNRDQMRLSDGFRSLWAALLLGLLLWGIATLLLGDAAKGGALAALGLVLFFSYGHLYLALDDVVWFGERLGRHRYLVPLFTAVLAGAFLLLRRLTDSGALTQVLNVVGLVLVLIPMARLANYELRTQQAEGAVVAEFVDPARGVAFSAEPPQPAPDVYFIILDAYGREDTLRQLIGYDNSEFLTGLQELGFSVQECAQSNYSQSELTLASTLNLAYLDDLGERFTSNRDDRTPLRPLIKNSLVQRTFEAMGYQIVAYETGYPFSEWTSADRYIRPDLSSLDAGWLRGLNGYEHLLLRSSGGLILLDYAHLLPDQALPDYEYEVRSSKLRTLYIIDHLPQLAQLDVPTFTFAHIVSPHRPFVFGPGGDAGVAPNLFDYEDHEERMAWYRQGYSDQIEYLNRQLLPQLEALIEASETPPLIVLQSDHGPEEGGAEDRMAILSAFYLPDGGQPELAPDLTSVNHFRLLLSEYFGADLPLLPDRSYYSAYNRPYDFQIVENACGHD